MWFTLSSSLEQIKKMKETQATVFGYLGNVFGTKPVAELGLLEM